MQNREKKYAWPLHLPISSLEPFNHRSQSKEVQSQCNLYSFLDTLNGGVCCCEGESSIDKNPCYVSLYTRLSHAHFPTLTIFPQCDLPPCIVDASWQFRSHVGNISNKNHAWKASNNPKKKPQVIANLQLPKCALLLVVVLYRFYSNSILVSMGLWFDSSFLLLINQPKNVDLLNYNRKNNTKQCVTFYPMMM